MKFYIILMILILIVGCESAEDKIVKRNAEANSLVSEARALSENAITFGAQTTETKQNCLDKANPALEKIEFVMTEYSDTEVANAKSTLSVKNDIRRILKICNKYNFK